MVKVSLITTFLDRAEYLSDCIESTLSQTFEDWELILFDDGSTDESLDICLEYARQDFRIKVIQSEHIGRASALVEAYKYCSGKVSVPWGGIWGLRPLAHPPILEQ